MHGFAAAVAGTRSTSLRQSSSQSSNHDQRLVIPESMMWASGGDRNSGFSSVPNPGVVGNESVPFAFLSSLFPPLASSVTIGAARNNGVPANSRKGVNDAHILSSPR